MFDYEAGKADWFAAGLAREGTRAAVPRIGDIVRRDDVMCHLEDRLGDAAGKVRAAGKDACIVVTDGDVVLGRVRGEALDADPDALVESVMESGPTTFRTDATLESVAGRMATRSVDSVLVATSDGRLVGTLYRSDAERVLAETQASMDEDESSCNCDE